MIERLEFLMKKNNVNKSELAYVLDLNRSAITKIFNEERALKVNEIKLICKKFNVSSDFLFGFIDEPISPDDCAKALNIIKAENNKNQPDKLTEKIDEKKAKDIVRELVRMLFDE